MKTYSYTEIKGCTIDASGIDQLHLYRWYEQNGVYYPVILKNDLNSVWDFVVEYYEGYSSCDTIAENNDLQCVVDGEIEEGSCAEDLYNEIKGEIRIEFGKTLDKETLEAESYGI